MKTAIVTGANGFVGTWLVQELVQQNVKVIAVVRDKKSNIKQLKKMHGVDIVFCALQKIHHLKELVTIQADTFFHLAWEGSTGDLRADYYLQLQNAKWTVDAVTVAANLGCRRFVGAGTLAEFDCGTYIPNSGSIPNAVSCYGSAKIAAHYMSKAIANSMAIEHVWAYLSNTYGLGNKSSNFVNFACKTMITGQPANFTIAEQPYDFVYVTDTAKALFLMGKNGITNSAYYIGSTKTLKLKEYIYMIRDAIDPAIQINLGAVPFHGEPLPTSVFDSSTLTRDTGFYPQVCFKEGIAKTVLWIRDEIKEGRLI